MNVGIVTPYRHSDTTYAALQLAEHARQYGHAVTILTPTSHPAAVHAAWDKAVAREAATKFTAWAAPLHAVIWMACPHPGQVEWTLKPRRGRPARAAIIVADALDQDHQIHDVYPIATRVMAPSLTLGDILVENYKLLNVVSAPWCVRRPATIKGARPGGTVRLHLPLTDTQGEAEDSWALVVGGDVLNASADARLTVSLASRSGKIRRRADRLARAFKGRLVVEKAGTFEEQMLRYGKHDLTLIPYIQQTFALAALASLQMGTPFVAFNYPPVNEFTVVNRTGVIARVRDEFPGESDYQTLIDLAVATVADAPLLARLGRHCTGTLAKRAEAFTAAWVHIFFGGEG